MSNHTEVHTREFMYNIPESVLFHPELKLSDMRIYMIIRSFMETTKSCYASNGWMAKVCKVTRKTVIQSINRLVKLGLVKRVVLDQKRYLIINYSPMLDDTFIEQTSNPEVTPPSPLGDPPSNLKVTQLDQSDYTKNNRGKVPPLSLKHKRPQTYSKKVGLADIQAHDTHNIPEDMMTDWIEVRRSKKKPITLTAIKRLMQELNKCVAMGYNAIDCFETMVSEGWQSLNADWIKNRHTQGGASKALETRTDWLDRDLGGLV